MPLETCAERHWTSQFGLAQRHPPMFFQSLAELEATAPPPPQTHAMRRAFIELGLDGIVCFANAPTVYFKEVAGVASVDLRRLQRRVWNQGLAPVLVVISPDAVHIYSGLALPAQADADLKGEGRWVETLDRVTQAGLIDEYFDVGPLERVLVDDTFAMALPSATPRRDKALEVPSLRLTTPGRRADYVKQLCDVLNEWAKRGPFEIRGRTIIAHGAGLGVVHLWRVPRGAPPDPTALGERTAEAALGEVLEKVEPRLGAHRDAILLARGVTVFAGPALYLLKPLTGRFWTGTAALNDADESAAMILARRPAGATWP